MADHRVQWEEATYYLWEAEVIQWRNSVCWWWYSEEKLCVLQHLECWLRERSSSPWVRRWAGVPSPRGALSPSQETGISLPRNWKCCSWRGWCWCYENIGSSVTYWGGIWLRILQIKTLVCGHWTRLWRSSCGNCCTLISNLDWRVRDTVGDHCYDEVDLLRLCCVHTL